MRNPRCSFLWATSTIILLVSASCSNLTPNQNLALDRGIYLATDVALTAGVKSGKIPQSAVPSIQLALKDAADHINAGQAWVSANPMLADTVGVYPTEFTLMHASVRSVFSIALQYQLLAPLPSSVGQPILPTTQPSR